MDKLTKEQEDYLLEAGLEKAREEAFIEAETADLEEQYKYGDVL